jgi:hypothetical protein
MVKAIFGDAVRSRCQPAMVNEALIKWLCHNIRVAHQAMVESGIKAEFWRDDQDSQPDDGPVILSLVRHG